jgi:Domain of unknown function (DUF4907)
MSTNLIKAIVLYCAVILSSCQNNAPATSNSDTNKDSINIGTYTFKTTEGWGYGITIDNRLYIKQSTIPALAGTKGFASEKDAEKVAALVINKIKLHKKPTIFKEELQSLQITE